ncbi:MAG: hypothetical protein ACI4MH_04475 [Candidatus Coproplasma sp.]
MNKTKKVAFAAVAVVMAGSMALSVTACGGSSSGNKGSLTGSIEVTKPTNLSADLTPNVDANDKLTYAANTELRMNVGNQNSSHPAKIAYMAEELTQTVTMPDGKTYNAGDLKPAWSALQTKLGVKLTESFTNLSGDNQITENQSKDLLKTFDLVTASGAAMTQNSDLLLNLNDYLYYMPNYAAFLEANPVVRFSLTSDTTNGAMYYAPYFDGNDDIEKYALAERSWVRKILDASDVSAATTTFKAQAELKGVDGTSSSAESYMGTTGSYTVDTTSADGSKVVKAKVDYDAALADAKSESGKIGAAYKAAVGSAYNGTSGNIVDIMNAAINATKGEITGAQLTKMLQAYIDVAYTLDGKAYTTRSDVFNSSSAAWDVDLMVALCRCAVTSGALIGATTDAQISNLYGLAARQGTTQRRVDLTALAGELYGVRGMESRYEYTYINSKGELVDTRLNADSYDLVSKMSGLAAEGLLYTGTTAIKASRDFTGPSSLLMHDYDQTQTTYGFTEKDSEKFDLAPIVTPISKWDTDDDGTHETIMRFTESWRSVKNTGFCIPKAAVQGNADKLSAALAFIDYLFSNDGQLLMTYGPQSTNGNTNPNGWWYATEVTDKKVEDVAYKPSVKVASTVEGEEGGEIVSDQYTVKDEYKTQYFIYENKVYTGFAYNGTQVPTVTTASMNFYLGEEVNGFKQPSSALGNISVVGNYTNYARYVVGTTLPIGNKNQGFEYQCTSSCGLDGANVVNVALQNGTINHVKLNIDPKTESWWYLITPTTLALTANNQTVIKGQTTISGKYFLNSSSTSQILNVYLDLAFYGFDTSRNIANDESLGKIKANGDAYVTWLKAEGMETRANIFSSCWTRTKKCFNIGTSTEA